eukprot:CAMPEP_0194047498 /NCGR_PEP_ID=MMETSP0009_2-20130614/25004_1 /TAXON_ID=210454 /ORGANISM="Grammatophora oceanica, Strain CCMP 410" /LENGTH=104 /DNA_ID=CAMNT_0038693147 /DNA_START=579 /DNA_END=890 /DNA_ORIENTATION=-
MAAATNSPPLCYEPQDFLFGSEKLCKQNGGNQLLRHLVLQYFYEYESADQKTDFLDRDTAKRSKQDINRIVLMEMKATGCRFLKRTMQGTWIEAAEKEAMKKIV